MPAQCNPLVAVHQHYLDPIPNRRRYGIEPPSIVTAVVTRWKYWPTLRLIVITAASISVFGSPMGARTSFTSATRARLISAS